QKKDRAKDGFGSRGPTRTLTEGNATYRISVGRRQRVMPGSIVGAIANEGGLSSSQIGGIDIRSDHTLVELPAELSKDQWRALSKTRISGELINLELDKGRRPAGGGGTAAPYKGREDRGDRGQGGFKKKFDGDRGGFRGDRDRGADRGADRGFSNERTQGHAGHGGGDRRPRHEGGQNFNSKGKW
ncbi:DbpA RNA binding domain-containing protein, partial [Arthrobacter sp.]